jgi:hypothetical protein
MACQSGPIGLGRYADQISRDYIIESEQRSREARKANEAHQKQKESRRRKVLRDIKRDPKAAISLIRAQKRELDVLTRLLCGLLKKYPALTAGNKPLASWWITHQKWDQFRKKEAKKKR